MARQRSWLEGIARLCKCSEGAHRLTAKVIMRRFQQRRHEPLVIVADPFQGPKRMNAGYRVLRGSGGECNQTRGQLFGITVDDLVPRGAFFPNGGRLKMSDEICTLGTIKIGNRPR